MPKVSVIIPVYNSQDYLPRCIQSIQSQSLSDIEILLIDDGSTDKTSSICTGLAKGDSRIKYYYQENSGVAAARQKGFEMSTGEYVIHIDSDDWIEPTMLEEMYDESCRSNADVVICDVLVEFSTTNKRYYSQRITNVDNKSVFSSMIKGELMCSVFNKLIKKDVIERHCIHFIPGLNTGEDMLYCCSLYRHEIKTSFVNKALYHYDLYTNNNSLTRNISQEKVEQRVKVSELLFEGLDESEFVDEKNFLLWKNVNMAFQSECDRSYFYSLFDETQKESLIELEKRGIDNVLTKRCVIHAIKGHLKTARSLNNMAMCLLNPVRKLIK